MRTNPVKQRLMKYLFLRILFFLPLISFSQNVKYKLETFVPEKENYTFRTISFIVPAFDRKQKIDSVSFEGSLIIPKNGFDKIVIIKPGTGYNTRNTHSYLAETLLDNNIAVFRYDERGNGNSNGEGGIDMHYTATMMGAELASAFTMLKKQPELQDKKFGVIGHSLGGVATIDALKYNINPDFLVLLATPVVTGKQLFLYQLENEENGFNDYFLYDTQEEKQEICSKMIDFYIANQNEKKYYNKFKKNNRSIGYKNNRYSTRFPFLLGQTEKDLIKKDNSELIKNLQIPLLYLIGDKDVLVSPNANIDILNNYNNSNIYTTIVKDENHFFANGESYEMNENPKKLIVEWILKQ